MSRRYFKSLLPRKPVILQDGRAVKFDTLDFTFGYLSPEPGDTVLVNSLAALAEAKRGGIVEIQEAEFTADYSQKKTEYGESPRRSWREELGGSAVPDTVMPARPAASQAATPSQSTQPPRAAASAAGGSAPQAASAPPVPRVGKRSASKTVSP